MSSFSTYKSQIGTVPGNKVEKKIENLEQCLTKLTKERIFMKHTLMTMGKIRKN